MKKKFTPGPWKAHIGSTALADTWDYIATAYITPLSNPKSVIADCFETSSMNEEEQAANANLIAKAPEMHALLEECCDYIHSQMVPADLETYVLYHKINNLLKAE